MKKQRILRNIFISVGVFFASAQLLPAGTNDGGLNVNNMPLLPPEPTFITFDPPGGPARDMLPTGINPAGAITGTYIVGSGYPNILNHGFVRAPDGTITTFDAPGAGTGPFQGTTAGVSGFGGPPINPAGVITGHYVDSGGVLHGFLRARDGTFTTVDAPGAINGTGFLCCITPSDAVAGASFDANFVGHGFVRANDGTFTTFDAPGDVNGTTPSGINPAGVITGSYADANFMLHGFVRARDGTVTTFDVPGAVNGTTPSGINPAGVITGAFFDRNFEGHGFLRAPDGTFTTFDAPGAVNLGTNPIGINPAQVITGWYSDAFTFHGFLRIPNGTITNVDPPDSASTFPSVINPAGIITGEYFDASGAAHGFLRVP